MTRPNRAFRAVAGLIAILAIATLSPALGQGGLTYSARTLQTIDQLSVAERAIAAGDFSGAQTALDGIGSDIDGLVQNAAAFREVANQELGRCGSRVQDLDRRIGEIRTEQDRVNTEIAGLEETLAAASERQRLSAEHITEINQRIAAAQAALAEKARRLDELQRWWWVPGYGLYLSIRTLADHDIEEVNSLSNSLNDEGVRLNQAGASLRDDGQLKAQLVEQIRADTAASLQLVAMHDQATTHMRELRAMALFLTEAEAFWLKAASVLGVTARGAAGDLQLLTSLLGKDLTLTEFDEEFQPGKTTMREALLGFAAAVDDGSSFLLDASTDYCGGPPRPIVAAPVSQACNISGITKYYEIVDPVRCSFRYLKFAGSPAGGPDGGPRDRGDRRRAPARELGPRRRSELGGAAEHLAVPDRRGGLLRQACRARPVRDGLPGGCRLHRLDLQRPERLHARLDLAVLGRGAGLQPQKERVGRLRVRRDALREGGVFSPGTRSSARGWRASRGGWV